MSKLKIIKIFLFLLPIISTAHGQTLSSKNSPIEITPPKTYFENEKTLNEINENIKAQKKEIDATKININNSLQDLKKDISALKISWWEKLIPAGLGLIGVLVGTSLSGWFSVISQKRQLVESQKAALREAANDELAKLADFRSKQLNEFYAPISFMLQRTGVVRNQLCRMLLESSRGKQKFFFKKENGVEHLYLKEEGGERAFRLIHDMHEIVTDFPIVLPLVGEIVNIGEQISKLIYDKGGLAKSDNTHLSEALGEYLGHYSILREIYSNAINSPDKLTQVKYSMAYPRVLDKLLKKDAEELTEYIGKWEKSAIQSAKV